MPISFEKLDQQAPALVKLAKKAQFNLSKHGLEGHRAKVALCLDFSGSMRVLYRDGHVQALAERVLALATQLDDDGAIDVFVFDTAADYLGEMTIGDFAGGVDRLTAGRRMGRTNYAAVMALVREHYAPAGRPGMPRKAHGPAQLPAYVMFLTDGAPDSRRAATTQLVEASHEAIFWQFMGVGEGPFDYLTRLDESVPGRLIDNASFFQTTDVLSVPDQELFAKMLSEYPDWLRAAAAKHLIQTQ